MKLHLTFLLVLMQVLLPVMSFAQTATGVPAPDTYTYQNFFVNSGAERNLANTTASGGSLTRTTTTPLRGKASFLIDASATSQTYDFTASTFNLGLKGRNCEARFKYAGDASLYNVRVRLGSSDVTTATTLPDTTSNSVVLGREMAINFPCGDASSAPSLRFTSTGNGAAFRVDDVYIGLATNIGDVSQATMYGGVVWANVASCLWTSTSGSVASFSAVAACTSPTGSNLLGQASAPATKIPGITFATLPPGEYRFELRGQFYQSTASAQYCYWRLTDGTNTSNVQITAATSVTNSQPSLAGTFRYTTAQSNITFQAQVGVDSANTCNIDARNAPFEIMVYRYPTAPETVFRANANVLPTVTRLTSGSGTYTTPFGVSHLRIRMAGGGGGGAGSSTAAAANGGTGGNGGDTTFGTSLLTANAGNGGNGGGAGGGAGGSSTVNSPAVTIQALTGSDGQTSNSSTVAGVAFGGGYGGASPINGLSARGGQQTSNSGIRAGSLGGGGGGGGSPSAGINGSGGGAGGFVEAYIFNPSSSYPYCIGSSGAACLGGSGTAGTAGTGPGFPGGVGGVGFIEITEYYQSDRAPVLIGSVTSNNSGAMRFEAADIRPTGSACTVQSSTSSWITSSTRNGTGDCSHTITGSFSSAPYCTLTPVNSTAGTSGFTVCKLLAATTSSTVRTQCFLGTTPAASDESYHLQCLGSK